MTVQLTTGGAIEPQDLMLCVSAQDGSGQFYAAPSDALGETTTVAVGDAAAQAIADLLGCSRAEAYRRAAVLVQRLMMEVSP
jgi:hypothetical protein